MAWEKSAPALVALFDASVPDDPRVERRQMFGYPAAFADGHLFMSLFQQDFVLRLAADDHAAFTARFGERPFAPMEGRVMRGYVRLSPALIADEGERAQWVARALANALALPAKPRKAPKARAG
jgi:TfoX/Sxy family transcriptional regulator of competence genes